MATVVSKLQQLPLPVAKKVELQMCEFAPRCKRQLGGRISKPSIHLLAKCCRRQSRMLNLDQRAKRAIDRFDHCS